MISEKQRLALRKQLLGENYHRIFSSKKSVPTQEDFSQENEPQYKWNTYTDSDSPLSLKWGKNYSEQVERIHAVEQNKTVVQESAIQDKPKSKYTVL